MTQQFKALDLEGRLLPPTEVVADRFKVGEMIGEGPFGQVYKAEDTLIETGVALKVFAKELLETPLDEEQFLKATRTARALTQKNVVRLHASGIHKDFPWVSMQYLESLNLRKVVRLRRQRKESFSLEELDPIVSQITLAVQHIGRDHPHGNLKPENIILLPDLVKVTDSYMLTALPADEFARYNADNPFIAPELLSDGSDPDVQCDVYSVGAIIGYMLFGDDYQPGTEADAPGALGAVDALCNRAMAFDPAERYQSVEALNEDFASIVDTGARLSGSPGDFPSTSSAPDEADADDVTELSDSDLIEAPEPEPEEQPVDPLDVETSPDIGATVPSRDAVSTEDDQTEDGDEAGFLTGAPEEQSSDLADLLPTDEVDRDQMPPPGEKGHDELAYAETAAAMPEADPSSSPSPQPEPSEPPPPEEPAEKAPSPQAAQPGRRERASQKPKKKSGILVAILGLFAVVGGIVVIGGVGAGVFFFVFSDADDDVDAVAEPAEIAEEEEQALAEAAPDELGAEEDEVADEDEVSKEEKEELERLRREREEALAAAAAIPLQARGKATEDAEEKAEELEEEEEAAGAGASPAGAARARPQPTQCPGDMVRVSVGGEYACVDAYQYPGRGHMPKVNVSWFDARRLCDQQDKRLCTRQEWRAACGHTFPYGSTFDPDRCNTVDGDGFGRQLAETGSFPQCRSPSGAYDMSGNVHEWVEEQRVVGGDFDSGAQRATCSYSSAMSPGSSRGSVGFRCCASPS